MGRCHPATRAQIATGIGIGTGGGTLAQVSVGAYRRMLDEAYAMSTAALTPRANGSPRTALARQRRVVAVLALWSRGATDVVPNFAALAQLVPENAFRAVLQQESTDSLVEFLEEITFEADTGKGIIVEGLRQAAAAVIEERLHAEGLTQGQRARSRSRSRSATPDQPDFDFDFGGDDGEGPSVPVLNPLQNLPRRRGGTQAPADRKGKAPLQPPVLPPLRNLPPLQRLPPPMLSGIPPSRRIVPMARSRRLIPSMRWPAPMESALPPVPLPPPMLSGRPPRHPGQPPAGARRRRTAARPQKRPVRRPARYEGTPDPPPPTPRRRNAVVNPSGRPTRQRPPAVSRRRPAIFKLPEVGRNQRATRPPKRLLDL